MHATKCKLIERNGLRCMGCGKVCNLHKIQWHHIMPKYVSKAYHIPQDDSYENGALLCPRCHATLHKYLWWDWEYQKLTDLIVDNKN
jgi:5-methylcytosine-specific restriction endonuclease McrA